MADLFVYRMQINAVVVAAADFCFYFFHCWQITQKLIVLFVLCENLGQFLVEIQQFLEQVRVARFAIGKRIFAFILALVWRIAVAVAAAAVFAAVFAASRFIFIRVFDEYFC